MKAYHQIDLSGEKKIIWSLAIVLSFVGVLFVIHPLQAFSADNESLWMRTQVKTADFQFQDLPIFEQSLEYLTDSFCNNDSGFIETEFNITDQISEENQYNTISNLILILFNEQWRRKFEWVYNPGDSSVFPILTNSFSQLKLIIPTNKPSN